MIPSKSNKEKLLSRVNVGKVVVKGFNTASEFSVNNLKNSLTLGSWWEEQPVKGAPPPLVLG